jgi:membrane fusion protein
MSTTEARPGPVPLFRPEVRESQQAQWLGSIRIGRPVSFTMVTGAALAMALALAAFACWGSMSRKVTVQGLLLPAGGLMQVKAPQAGVIAQLLVQEGDVVRAGQPLLRLKSERITAAGDMAALNEQALTARRSSLDAERRLAEQGLMQRQDSLQQRLRSLLAEERQAQAELETHQLRLQLAQTTLERQQQLAREGFVAAAHVQQRQEEMLDLQLRERNARRNQQALARDVQGVKADLQTLNTQTRASLEQLGRSRAELDQQIAEADSRSGLVITAPRDGRVSAITLGVGQNVQSATTLLSLVPLTTDTGAASSDLQAQLFAPSHTSGFVRPGQAVWLRYAAFPYQKFGMARGEVIAISRSPIALADLPTGQAPLAGQAGEPLYRITVRLSAQTVAAYGQSMPLAAGMRLDADVEQERRRIWEWLLEPVLSIARRSAD